MKKPWPQPHHPVINPVIPIPTDVMTFRCVECFHRADMIYKGTTYCEPCLKEKRSVYGI